MDTINESPFPNNEITSTALPLLTVSSGENMGLTWNDTEDIGLALMEKFPDTDPLTVRFTDLHQWVTELPNFSDDPKKSNEGLLEAIQMAWYEEYTSEKE